MLSDNILSAPHIPFECGRGKLTILDIVFCDDKRDAIIGQIKDKCGKPIENALIVLYQNCRHKDHKDDEKGCKRDDSKPVSYEFSNKHGEFAFGPLCNDKEYFVRAWLSSPVKVEHECITFCDSCDCLKADCNKPGDRKFLDDLQ